MKLFMQLRPKRYLRKYQITNALQNSGNKYVGKRMGTDNTYHNEINRSSESKVTKIRNTAIAIVLFVCLVALYFLSRYNYLLFHSIVEIFSVVIAFAIFAIAWNSRRLSDNTYFLFIGIAFLFIGTLDTLHTLAYNGMGVFPNIGTNLATQVWIASRYVESFSLLVALLFVQRRFQASLIFTGYFTITGLFLASIYLGIFPTAFINGKGLTPFKIVSEYVISFVLLGAIGLFWRKRSKFNENVAKLLIAAMAVTIASEMAFTLYTDAFGLANVIGHLLKVVAFYLIYKAFVETGLSKPYDLLFHNLKQNESSLKKQAAELEEINSRLILEASERKKAEEALIQSEKKYRTLYETSLDGIIARDPNGKFIDCNQSYARMVGYKKEEISHLGWQQLIPEKWRGQREEVANEVLETGSSIAFEREYQRKDGTIFPASVKTWRLTDDKGKTMGTWSIVRDITEQKELQEKLEQHSENLKRIVEEQTKQLRDAERLAAIGATAGMVGHDIRNPLQAITSDVYLAKTDLSSFPESEEKKNMQESLEEIEKNISYINKIVADLQDFARPKTPKLEETDLEQTIHLALTQLTIPKNVTVKHSVRKAFPKIKIDQAYMQRILTNLANNAIQAMPNGGELSINAVTENAKAIISVEDTGEGIPESVKDRLFTPLVTTKSKGQGFGLSVVKRLTEGMGGTVTFESSAGKGTKFIIELPL
jgi:PAS domain S-box-containing protein